MTLRKYTSAWISSVEQHEFERIALFNIRTKMGNMKLILELFGEGNIILVGEKGEILQALFFKRMRDRNIVRNETYQYPPSSATNPFKVTLEELDSALKMSGETEVVRCIIRFLGLGGVYGEELLQRAQVEKTKRCEELSNNEVDAIFNSLQQLLSQLSADKLQPIIVLDDADGFMDVVPFKLKRYENNKVKSYDSFSQALDEFYVRVTAAEKAVASIDVGQFKREAERLKRMISEQERALEEGEKKIERNKSIGDTIYAHFSELQILLERFSSTYIQGKDLKSVVTEVIAAKKAGNTPEAFYESFDGKNLAINIQVNELKFSLSIRKSLYENAAEFYDRGKSIKQKGFGVTAALEDSRKKLAEIEKQLSKVEALKVAAPVEAMEDLETRKVASKEWYEKFRWF